MNGIRDRQRTIWATAAPFWERWLPDYERWYGPLSQWLCDAAGIGPGTRVLDIACGTGQPALPAAMRGARVTAIDLVPEMIAAVGRRAEALGVDLDRRVMDAEALGFPEASFDAVTCAFGLMFVPDAPRAVAEIHRVLRPGGRFAIAVWDKAERNPYFGIMGPRVARRVPSPTDPRALSGFRFAPDGEFEAVLRAGGFETFSIESRPFALDFESPEHLWQLTTDFVAPLRAAIASLAEDAVAELRAEVRQALVPYTEDRIRVPASALCASGSKVVREPPAR